jgi:uncharacterized protein YnzC (UPF0291/DUF896 family)
MVQEKIDRINFLARESKVRELTAAEKEEQARLRREYIDEFRLSLGGILDNTVIKRPDGSVEPLKKDDKKN